MAAGTPFIPGMLNDLAINVQIGVAPEAGSVFALDDDGFWKDWSSVKVSATGLNVTGSIGSTDRFWAGKTTNKFNYLIEAFNEGASKFPGFIMENFRNGWAGGFQFLGIMAQGTAAAPTNIGANALLVDLAGMGYVNGNIRSAGSVYVGVDTSVPASPAAYCPGVIVLRTVGPATGGSMQARFRLDSSGRLVIGPNLSAHTNAIDCASLEIQSTTGFLVVPRMSTAQRDAVPSPQNGAILYNTTLNKFQGRAAAAWIDFH